jgi:hypothetical protein
VAVDAHRLLLALEAVEADADAVRAAVIERAIPWAQLLVAMRDGGAGAWRADAACRGQSHLMFVGVGGSSAQGLELCRSCTVQPECARWAAAHPEQGGIAGGSTEADRAKVRRLMRGTAA